MIFETPLQEGRLLRRYKRFLADVRLKDGREVTAHVPNTGAMTGCDAPGSQVWLSEHDDPKRKHRFTLEIVDTKTSLVGVNTARANALVAEALVERRIPELEGYDTIRREVPFDESRIDFQLSGGSARPDCFVEVKSVTLVEKGVAKFPDAVTLRGQKHLETLGRIVGSGHRAALLFVVQRADGAGFRPAYRLDPEYGRMLRAVHADGVELLVYRAWVSPEEIRLTDPVPWEL